MSLKRILGLTISLMDLIIIIAMFLPYSGSQSLMAASGAAAMPLIVMNAIGFIFGVIGKKSEINYANTGAALFFAVYILLVSINQNAMVEFLQNVGISYYILFVASLFGFLGSAVYSFTSTAPKEKKPAKVSTQGGIQQRTNSLNMNMPVNNYQALPVTVQEKQKAPMDVLLRAGDPTPPPIGTQVVQGNTVQSHMSELGLKSINISQDNLTGAVQTPMNNEPQLQKIPPMTAQPMIMGGVPPMPNQMNNVPGTMMEDPIPGIPTVAPMQIQPQQAKPPLVEQTVPGGIPNQQPVPGQQAPMAQNMPKPDLLAGSAMSGQLDASPYNSGPVQPGQGQFF